MKIFFWKTSHEFKCAIYQIKDFAEFHMRIFTSYGNGCEFLLSFLELSLCFSVITFPLDVNECDSPPYCDCQDKQTCMNTNGSCTCRCVKGFTFLTGTGCIGT